MDKTEDINVGDDKYTVQFNPYTGEFKALRHGEPWRDLSGDKLVYCMYTEIIRLRGLLYGYDGRIL